MNIVRNTFKSIYIENDELKMIKDSLLIFRVLLNDTESQNTSKEYINLNFLNSKIKSLWIAIINMKTGGYPSHRNYPRLIFPTKMDLYRFKKKKNDINEIDTQFSFIREGLEDIK